MHGKWGWDAKACADKNSDGRVLVDEKQVAFFASTFTLSDRPSNQLTMSRGVDGTLRLKGIVQEEGRESAIQGTIALKLLSPDRLRIDRTDHVYIQCPS